MAKQANEMDVYFGDENGDDDGISGFTLPSARKIEREAFSVEDFNVDKFLSEYHRYQTLEDMQQQLQKWSKSLEQELVDLINEDYNQFVGLGTSLSEGQPKVEDVKMELMSFQQEIKTVQTKLQISAQEVDVLIQEKSQLTEMEMFLSKLILYGERLNDVESRIKSDNIYNLDELEELAKSYLSCESVLSKLPASHPFVVNQRSRQTIVRIHIHEVFPRYFKSFKQVPKSIRQEQGAKLFSLLLLFKQIAKSPLEDTEN